MKLNKVWFSYMFTYKWDFFISTYGDCWCVNLPITPSFNDLLGCSVGRDLDAFHDSLQSASDLVKWLLYQITGAEGDPEKYPFLFKGICDSVWSNGICYILLFWISFAEGIIISFTRWFLLAGNPLILQKWQDVLKGSLLVVSCLVV